MKPTPQHLPELLQKILDSLQGLKLNELSRVLKGALETPTREQLLWLSRPHKPQVRQRI